MFTNIRPFLGKFHKFKVIFARIFKTVVDIGSCTLKRNYLKCSLQCRRYLGAER